MIGMEVITTHDKAVRDRLFNDLRENGNEAERKVVKFSGNEPVLESASRVIRYGPNAKPQYRPVYRSTWSVAYPKF